MKMKIERRKNNGENEKKSGRRSGNVIENNEMKMSVAKIMAWRNIENG